MSRLSRRDALRLFGASAAGTAVGLPAVTGKPVNGPSGGSSARWTTGEQYGIGTVQDHHADDPSRVWFTLTEGALASVRFPRIDLMNLRTFDFLVVSADDASQYTKRTFNVDRRDDEDSTIERTTRMVRTNALVYRQTIRETGDSGHRWKLVIEYAVHPTHESVLIDVRFTAQGGNTYDVYAVADPSLSNSGMGDIATANRRKRGRGTYLSAHDTNANDDSAVFLDREGNPYNNAISIVARDGFDWTTVDVVGGDSLSPLLVTGDDETRYERAEGNVALVGRIGTGTHHTRETIALGFAENADEVAAYEKASQSLGRPFPFVRERYAKTWREYVKRLRTPDAVEDDDRLLKQYNASAMAVKAAESKQFPGAGIASLCVPWGSAVVADEPSDYGYNFTWSRDLYQAFTALDAIGDVESALNATEYIYDYQQDENGFIPQNTYIDGRTRWGGEQMDNISFPQIMAYQLRERHGIGFDDASYGYENVKRSADYVVANGPSTGQERWEEESGYSPSTTAAEIAGLACAASLATGDNEEEEEWEREEEREEEEEEEWEREEEREQEEEEEEDGDEGREESGEGTRRRADALVYLALADKWQQNVENWMATDEGTDQHTTTPYYFRINDDRDPDEGAPRSLANGGPTLDERNVIDAGFLELVRLGVKPWDDPVVRNSLSVVDETIRVDTPNGPGWYRYNGDGYGEQGEESDAYDEGAPWSLDNAGKGRLWPIFAGERGEYELLRETDDGPLAPASLLQTMQRCANSGRMIPEQVWDQLDSTDYGWTFGEGTGSATPLSWSMAQFVRLAHSIDDEEPVETPEFVRERYVDDDLSDSPSLDVEFPETVVENDTVTVQGTTSGEEIVVKTDGETVYRSVGSSGSFSAAIGVGDGETQITVVAATGEEDVADAGTTVARKTVVHVDVGQKEREWNEPTDDDSGPGSYVYPTADAFVDGAFDITSFGLYETDTTYQFLFGLGNLTNPWGGTPLSLQTFQIYVRDPGANDGTGTTKPRKGVNATFEAPYHQRVFVEGFIEPVVEASDGSVVSRDVSVTAYRPVDIVKIEVPKNAIGGSLTRKQFVPLLLGQDGFSPGRIRPVKAGAGGYVFGGGRDDTMDPNVIDLVTPDGISQSEALGYSATEQAVIPYLSL
jgi:GH15 family glucan-1,4-alpha-glucosidase